VDLPQGSTQNVSYEGSEYTLEKNHIGFRLLPNNLLDEAAWRAVFNLNETLKSDAISTCELHLKENPYLHPVRRKPIEVILQAAR
jgi:hypothetical protein